MESSAGPGRSAVLPELEARLLEESLRQRLFQRPRAPVCVGRYRLQSRLGEGAMGVVYRAHDDQLDRRVAVKVLRAGRDSAAQGRLRREALALARLSHPNVVQVFEVGEADGQTFVAMELVDGVTLRAWLDERPRALAEVVAMFVQAGRGLAAAHAAGLVHRDFKPENAFVGGDGRVRVGDFGLASPEGEVTITRPGDPVGAHDGASLTATSAMIGTPIYMAPEQFLGRPTDARTDQFSFCVALWEALHGARPFAGATVAQLSRRVIAGERAPPPPGRRVPAWLRRVLDRGLSREPGERWPTTDALLAALLADPTGRRRMLMGLAGVTLVGLAIAGWFGVQHRRESLRLDACAAEGASIAEVWSPKVADRLRAGLLASGAPHAEAVAARVVPLFAAQADAWQQARAGGCVDAVRGAWSEDLRDRSAWCLDEQRMEMEALISELSHADAAAARQAVVAAAGLSPVGACRDARRLAALPPLPPGRAGVQAVLRKLSRAGALRAAAEYDEGLIAAGDALTAAEALGWPPLTATARLRRGELIEATGKYPEAERELEEAYFQAAEVGALEVAAAAAADLTWNLGMRQKRPAEALRWSRQAEVMLTILGVGEHDLQRADAVSARAIVHVEQGRYAEARPLLIRALEIREHALGPDHHDVASALNNLAYVEEAMGAYAAATALHTRALASIIKTLGPDHPEVATSLGNLAQVQQSTGAYKDAVASLERALTIQEAAFGPNHPEVAYTLNNLGAAHSRMGAYTAAGEYHARALPIAEAAFGREHPFVATVLNNHAGARSAAGAHEEARVMHVRALAIREKELGPEHPEVANSLGNLGVTLAAMGRHSEAEAHHRRALAIDEKVLGPDNPTVAHALANLARALAARGAHVDAKAAFERALAIQERTLAADHPHLAVPLTGLARLALVDGRPADAAALAERAVRVREAAHAPPEKLAESRLALALALRAGGDVERAARLATAARAGFGASSAWQRELAEVDALLAGP